MLQTREQATKNAWLRIIYHVREMATVPPDFHQSSISPTEQRYGGTGNNTKQGPTPAGSGAHHAMSTKQGPVPAGSGAHQASEALPSRESPFSLSPSPSSMEPNATSRHAVLNQYLQDTGLLQVMSSWALLLVGVEDLPYNPYPTFAWYARRLAERFHMFDEDEEALFQNIDNSVYSVGGHIARTQESPAHWGLYTILKAVSSKTLEKYDLLLASMAVDVACSDADKCSVIPVLVGPCVFAGSLYQETVTVQIRMEYGINGSHLQQAAEIFSESVLNDVRSMEEGDMHILLDVSVPEQDSLGTWISKFWTYEAITNNQEAFVSAVQFAAENQKIVSLECLFRLDPDNRVYQRGQKQYNLNFISVQPGSIACMSPQPYLSAFEGVFLSNSPIRDYLAWFANVQLPEHTPVFREPTTSTTKRSTGLFSRRSKQSNTNQPAAAANSRIASGTQTAFSGYASGTTDSSVFLAEGPYAEEVQQAIRSYLSMKISSLRGEENLFPMLHYVILMLLLDRDSEESLESLIEAIRLLRSSAYKLHLLIEQNNILQDLVTRFTTRESAEIHVVQSHYTAYRKRVEELFCNDLQERSCDFLVAGRVLLERLDAITVKTNRQSTYRTLPIHMEVVRELQVINRYCTTLLLGVVDDTLSFCPHLVHHFPSLDSRSRDVTSGRGFKHGMEVPALTTQGHMYINLEEAKAATGAPGPIARQAAVLKYLVDTRFDETLEKFLAVLLSGSSLPPNPYPRLVSHLKAASVSMELFGERRDRLVPRLLTGSAQLVDSDNYVYHTPGCEAYVLEDFKSRKTSRNSFLKPKPNRTLRVNSQHDGGLNRQQITDSSVAGDLENLHQVAVRTSVIPVACNVFQFIQHQRLLGYGVISAVAALDSKSYNSLLAKLRLVSNKVNTRVTELALKASVGVAISGFTPLYGRVMPYIHDMELEEHYFIRGPRNAKSDAIHYFTKLVYDHMAGFAEKDEPSLLFVGMFLGNAGLRRSLQDIVPPQRKKAFMTQLVATVKSKQPIYMKAYILIDWRLVLIRKNFMLHFVEGQFLGYHRFYNQKPLAFYQNVFSSQEVASLFARACGPQDRADPCGGANLGLSLVHVNHVIERARHDGDLLAVYRWLLARTLMNQHSSYVAEAWYMMHGAAAQLEYLQTLNKTLQNLVYEELSRTFSPVREDTDTTSLLDQAVLGQMLEAYSDKLHKVLEQGTCMTPSGLWRLLQEKLDMVADMEPSSQGLRLLVTEMTPIILQDINDLLQPLMDSSAYVLHQVCPEVHHALRSLEAEVH